MEKTIDEAVNAWVAEYIHGSPVSQNTEAYNPLIGRHARPQGEPGRCPQARRARRCGGRPCCGR